MKKTKRSTWSHKGQFGKVFIIGGSNKYSGSPIFNAIAALRSGADLITIVGPERPMNISASFLPDIITIPLKGKELNSDHTSLIINEAKNFDSVIIGGGLNRSKETQMVILELIKTIDLPMVIDAEAIRAVAMDVGVLKGKTTILTPHKEEFRVLAGEMIKDKIEEREKAVHRYAKEFGSTILLKGSIDVISDGEKVGTNKTGSYYMTKGGFGDTLSGICGTMLARGFNAFDAAMKAAYINGKAGEKVCKIYKDGVVASDIFEAIPSFIDQY